MNARRYVVTGAFLLAACGDGTGPENASLARVPRTTHGAHQVWEAVYVRHIGVRPTGAASGDSVFFTCQGGSMSSGPNWVLTFKRTGNRLEGRAGSMRMSCVDEPFPSTAVEWDTVIAGGPTTGRFTGDSLLIMYSDWQISGLVSPPDGQTHDIFFPPAEGPYLLGRLCSPIAYCSNPDPTFGSYVAMKRVS